MGPTDVIVVLKDYETERAETAARMSQNKSQQHKNETIAYNLPKEIIKAVKDVIKKKDKPRSKDELVLHREARLRYLREELPNTKSNKIQMHCEKK